MPQHCVQLRVLMFMFFGIKRVPGQCKIDKHRTPCRMFHNNVVRLHVILYDAMLVNASQACPQLVPEASVGRVPSIPGAALYQ